MAAYTTQSLIGWDDVFSRGVLTASSDQVGGEKENAADGFTFDFWKPVGAGPHTLTVTLPAGVYADYVAIAAHNLAAIGGSIKLQAWNGAAFIDLSALVAVPAGAFLLRVTPAITNIYQLVVTGANPVIGVVQCGAITVLPEGLYVDEQAPTLNPETEILNSTSEGGQFLGRSLIRSGVSDSIRQDRVSNDWVRSTWAAFMAAAQLRPFFWSWRHDEYPGDVIYAWSTGDAKTKQAGQGFSSVELAIRGVK